ncbi:hypothetical protein BJV78DRAFT_1165015, partial [Lactifluus subvellereus]
TGRDSGFGTTSSRTTSPRDSVISSSKESSDRHKEQGRPSKISDDDVEPVKQLCSMGFSRTQAVAALEASSYDVQRALNSLLSG